MKMNARIAALAAALSLYGAVTAGAQETPKPPDAKKVARDVSKAAKMPGVDTKAATKRNVSTAHGALADPGNDAKSALKKATGIKAPQPGGVSKMAGDVSKTPKKAGSDLKAQAKQVKGAAHGPAHGAATEAGKGMKDAVPKPKP